MQSMRVHFTAPARLRSVNEPATADSQRRMSMLEGKGHYGIPAIPTAGLDK
jgi:hypothetical protein